MMNFILRVLIAMMVSLAFAAGDSPAQFVVTSSSPADGAVSVPTAATLEITFSAPVDTTARFDLGDEFFLVIETTPEIPEPVAMGISADRLTFFAQVVLEPDTQYLVLLTGARSEGGQPLARPFAVSFTTGASMPTGSVSGTITEAGAGKAADGTLVALFPDDPMSGIFGEGGPYVAAVAVAGGQYTLNYVAAGPYQVAAAGDANGDGLIEIQLGDTFGLYDEDGDGLVDVVDVADGESVSGVNITVAVPPLVSARSNAAAASSIATSVYSDAVLTAVSAELLPSGLSSFWNYVFYSASSVEYVGMLAVGSQFVLAPADIGMGADLTEPLPPNWLDSDDVAAIADENGAADFVDEWPFVDVLGFAASVTEAFGKRSGKANHQRRGVFNVSVSGSAVATGNGSSTTPTPLWTLFYDGWDSEGGYGFLNLLIHAETGEVNPPLAYFTSAGSNVDVANAAALNWSSSAELVSIESGFSGVHQTGVSSEWTYTYRSSASNTAYFFRVQEGVIIDEGSLNVALLRSTQQLPATWVDSPQATGVAEAESGGFRDQYPNSYVEAVLARDIDFNNPTRPVWEFQYWDGSSGSNVTVLVDAETGLVVGFDDPGTVPSTLRLDQNYPNPFNPSTNINYEVPVAGTVRLSVFDLLGRRVRMLVDGERPAGRYTVVWDGLDDNGRPMSSGIYMYRVDAAGSSKTRSMTLLR